MSTSKLQRQVSQALSVHFARYIIRENSRPDWCLSDEYERLELDFYLPELNVAIEVQGAQHYQFTPHFHATYEDFQAQLRRDEVKKQRCLDYGITLLEVYDELSFSDVFEKLREIERVYSLAIREPITPKQWRSRLTSLNGELLKYWSHRKTTPYDLLVTKVLHQKDKLMLYTSAYGMEIFQYVDAETATLIFKRLQKLLSWIKCVRKGTLPRVTRKQANHE